MNNWKFNTPGIPDNMFIRGKVPMTKEEVRALTISKLRLKNDLHVVDIGAGTGSVSIEAALICTLGKVTAIEKNLEGIQLIKQNAESFNVNNIKIIHGRAVETLRNMEAFDRVFVGGSGGELKEILILCKEKLNGEGLVVINSITIETLYQSVNILKELEYKDVDVTLMSVAKGKGLGNYTLMEGLNPIYIVSARR